MNNLLIATLLLLLEGAYEGLKLKDHHYISEAIEDIFLFGVYFVTFGWNNGILPQHPRNPEFIFIFLGVVLYRYSIFDLIHNLFAGQPITFVGKTKIYDLGIGKLSGMWNGHLLAMTKLIALLWGVAWIMGWRLGILL
jgi:hypothetical protein